MSKSDSTGNFTFVRDGASPTAPVLTDAYATYTPGISDWRGSGHERFYGLDREGTNSVETDLTQSVQAAKTFDAFGNLVSMTGSSSSPFGYIGGLGYQTDSDTGLMLLGHRYYDPSTGRFLTRDHAKAGRNWYDYADNNPLKEVDPSGLSGGLPGDPGELLRSGWVQDPGHWPGGVPDPGGQGRYYPPGEPIGGNGLEFHNGVSTGQGPHYHEIINGEKQNGHLKEGDSYPGGPNEEVMPRPEPKPPGLDVGATDTAGGEGSGGDAVGPGDGDSPPESNPLQKLMQQEFPDAPAVGPGGPVDPDVDPLF